jgi:hypothetical protein
MIAVRDEIGTTGVNGRPHLAAVKRVPEVKFSEYERRAGRVAQRPDKITIRAYRNRRWGKASAFTNKSFETDIASSRKCLDG